MKFIDLFAGLGGFHLALAPLGHKCVFACEINPELNRLYQANFGMRAAGDINDVRLKEIPDHDILCAGFPCQPFSHAGKQEGRRCGRNGNLIDNIIRILRVKRPAFFILENVPNLLSHNKGSTWADILKALSRLRYHVEHRMLSPMDFGIPQSRKRMFILGAQGRGKVAWPRKTTPREGALKKILDKVPCNEQRLIKEKHLKCLAVWQELLDLFEPEEFPSYPIWSKVWGPYKNIHAMGRYYDLPKHSMNFIIKNREFYSRHKERIDGWLEKTKGFEDSCRKLEWQNRKGRSLKIKDHLIQFRPSGIRLKTADHAPTLVAVNQIPVQGWNNAYIPLKAMLELQCFPKTHSVRGKRQRFQTLEESQMISALGNAVNVRVARQVAMAGLRRWT